MASFIGGLADAAAGAGAFMRGGAQRAQDDLAVQNQKQQGELQGLQLAQGKLQVEEATNQRNLERALQEGYQSWIGKQKQAAGIDAANASTQQSAMLDYTKRVGEMSAGGSKPVGLGDAGPVPAQPTAPTEEGKASLYSHLAEIAARTPGGYRMAEELTKAHKMARDEGYLDATKVAMRGGDPEAVIQAFNKSGAMKVMPGTGYRDENGIYYAKTQDGKETSFNPRQWAVTFGLLNPDEYDVKDGVMFNKNTGASTPVQKQYAPKDYFITLKDADGAEVLFDLRKGTDGATVGVGSKYGVGTKDRDAINSFVLKTLGASDFNGLASDAQQRAAKSVVMAQYLIAKGAMDPDTEKLLSPEAAGKIALDATDGTLKSEAEQRKYLDSFVPKENRGKSSGPQMDPASVSIAELEKTHPGIGKDLEAVRDKPAELAEFNRKFTGDPNSGAAERILGIVKPNSPGEIAPGEPLGLRQPRDNRPEPSSPKASTEPKPQLPRPEPARLQKMTKQELAGMVKFGMKDFTKEQRDAMFAEADRRGLQILRDGISGHKLVEREEPVRSGVPAPDGVALDSIPRPGAPGKNPSLGEAGAASVDRPAASANAAPTPPGLMARPTIPIRPSADKAPATTPPATTTKPGATPKTSAAPRGLADAPNGYEATRRQAGKGATPEKQGAGSKPATDQAVTQRRAEASKQAARKLQDGDVQWFKDNMEFLKPETRRIYVDAINKRLERDGFGGKYPKGTRVTVDPKLPSF